MQLDRSTTKKILLIIAAGAAIYTGFQHLGDVSLALGRVYSLVSPFLLGGAVAFIINVPMRSLERALFSHLPTGGKYVRLFDGLRRAARPLSLVLTILLILGVFYLAGSIIAPEIANSLGMVADSLPAFAKRVTEFVNELGGKYPDLAAQLNSALTGMNFDWQNIISNAVKLLGNASSSLVVSLVAVASSIVGGLVSFFLALVFALYVLLQKEKLAGQAVRFMRAYLPEAFVDRTLYILTLSERTFSRFLSGQCMEAVILGSLFFVAMSIFRFPYALMISVLIAVTALIPIFGAMIGCVVGALLILIVAPQKVLWFIILFLVVQQLEGNLIYPYVVGNSVGLPPIWVLVAVTLGGSLMGILGMLLFIPLCSVCYSLLRDDVRLRLDRKKSP